MKDEQTLDFILEKIGNLVNEVITLNRPDLVGKALMASLVHTIVSFYTPEIDEIARDEFYDMLKDYRIKKEIKNET